MKKLSLLFVALMAAFLFAQPVFAAECTALIAKVDAQLQAAEITEEAKSQVMELRAEGETLCTDGNDEAAVEVLREALSILEG